MNFLKMFPVGWRLRSWYRTVDTTVVGTSGSRSGLDSLSISWQAFAPRSTQLLIETRDRSACLPTFIQNLRDMFDSKATKENDHRRVRSARDGGGTDVTRVGRTTSTVDKVPEAEHCQHNTGFINNVRGNNPQRKHYERRCLNHNILKIGQGSKS